MTPSDRLAIRVPNLGLARGFWRMPQCGVPLGYRKRHEFNLIHFEDMGSNVQTRCLGGVCI